MPHFAWTALVTLVALIVYIMMGIGVGRARAKYKVPAPAMSGDPTFERHFRVQLNTLEWLPIFLASLWLFSACWGDRIAAGIGVIWIVGRIVYWMGYTRAAAARSAGFGIQGLAALALLIGALVGVVQSLLAGGG